MRLKVRDWEWAAVITLVVCFVVSMAMVASLTHDLLIKHAADPVVRRAVMLFFIVFFVSMWVWNITSMWVWNITRLVCALKGDAP